MIHMKRFVFSFLALIAALVSVAQPKKMLADKIIAVVGNKVILRSDIENSLLDMQRQNIEIPANARCMSLEQAIGVKALVLQAEIDSLQVTEEEVDAELDNQIRYFINAYGSKDELERISGKSIYQLKEDFREGFRERKLAGLMRNKIVDDIRITPNEVKAYYNKIPVDSLIYYESELEVGQIIKYPKASRESEEYCIEQLKKFKEQIESGKKEFKTLAALYSDDPGSKDKGGQYELNRSDKQWDPIFLAKAFSLKDGQVSQPFKTKFGYHIIQMISRSGDDAVVRHILKIPQISPTEIKTTKDKLDSVRANLISGIISFGEAVSRYSDDDNSKFTGGRKTNNEGATSLTIDQLDKDLVVMLKDMKVGQFSQPTNYTDEKGKTGVRVVYLISKTEPHRENIKDDYNKISQRALDDKKNEALEKWLKQKVSGYFIKIDPEYQNCEEMKKWINAGNNK